MATYTSTQTGLWNDSTTWGGGGYPVAGDIANISHEVVYNITDSGSPFLGDINLNLNGHLRHLENTHLNMNGRILVSDGAYEMVDGVTVAFTGDNAHDHGIYLNTSTYTTFYANGTTPVAETRMSTSGDAGDYYIPVDDASDFQTGDWISVFFRYFDLKSRDDFFNEVNYPKGAMQGEGVTNTGQYGNSIFSSNTDRFHNAQSHSVTEGFIIHDIDSNNIYPRDLVGPDSSIESATTNKITVANSKVFRENQRIIFGHGAKRTASKITSINYRTHQITLEDNLSSTDVVGQSVYLGALKIHKYKRTVVRTVGNQVTAEAAANATSITLNNVSDYSVGDKFYVEHSVEDGDDWGLVTYNTNSWYQQLNKRHEITAINGNTLTFSPALPYKVYAGTFAYKANRPITVKGASDDPTDGTCKPYFYAGETGSTRTIDQMTRYRRKFVCKDVEFLGIGNSSSNYQYHIRGGFNDGYWRYSCHHEGNVVDGMGNSHNNYGMRLDGSYYHNFHNMISVNAYRTAYSGREGIELTNTVFMNSRRAADYIGTQNVGGKYAYMRILRSYENLRIYLRSMGQHIGAYQIYGENRYYNYCFGARNNIHQCHFKGRLGLVSDFNDNCNASYIRFDHLAPSGSSHQDLFFYAGSDRLGYYHEYGGTLYEMNYEIDNDIVFKGWKVTYDQTEGAYLAKDSWGGYYYYPAGNMESIMLKPNETVTISAEVKIHEDNPNSNWTYRPYLLYRLGGHQSGHRTASRGVPYLNVTGGDHLGYDFDFVGDVNKIGQNCLYPKVNYGYLGSENYDNSSLADAYTNRDQFDSKTEYIKRTITVTNEFPYSTMLYYGLFSIHEYSGRYGFYFKNLVVARDKSQTFLGKLGDRFRKVIPTYITKGTVASKQKKRIGGARL